MSIKHGPWPSVFGLKPEGGIRETMRVEISSSNEEKTSYIYELGVALNDAYGKWDSSKVT